jgi:hypothetical protein
MLLLFLFVSCTTDNIQNYDYVLEADISQPQTEEEASNDSQTTDRVEPDPESNNTEEPEAPEPTSDPENNTSESGICNQQNEGTSIGDCAQNFTLKDKDLQTISLHDFYGEVIFLDLSAFT